MVKNIVIFCAFLIAGIAMYRCHELSKEVANANNAAKKWVLESSALIHPFQAVPSSTHEMYQLWIDNGFYELRDGDRVVWKDKVGSGSDIDHLVTEDNL